MTEPIAYLAVPAQDLKMLREALCRAQSALIRVEHYPHNGMYLQQIINEVDRHRPLGSDGKHGNLHTPTCGCEDK